MPSLRLVVGTLWSATRRQLRAAARLRSRAGLERRGAGNSGPVTVLIEDLASPAFRGRGGLPGLSYSVRRVLKGLVYLAR